MVALSLSTYGQLGLDSVEHFAAYANGSLTVSNTTTINNGDLGLGPNGTANFITTPTYNNGTYVNSGLDYVSTTLISVSANADSLAATTNVGSRINSATTIIGNGGTNVIDVGSISLNGPAHTLTLQGGPNDIFIFNVSNYATFSGTAPALMALSGGVETSHILFNLLNTSGSANALSVTVPNLTLYGTFIAPHASMAITGSDDTIYGGVFAGGNSLSLNGSTITADVFMLPEPSTFALVGFSCLFGLALWPRRRR